MHPYFVATQAHPELKSRPTRPHPLFVGLVEAALDRRLATRLPVDGAVVEITVTGISGDQTRRRDPLAWPVDRPTVLAEGRDRHRFVQDAGPHARTGRR